MRRECETELGTKHLSKSSAFGITNFVLQWQMFSLQCQNKVKPSTDSLIHSLSKMYLSSLLCDQRQVSRTYFHYSTCNLFFTKDRFFNIHQFFFPLKYPFLLAIFIIPLLQNWVQRPHHHDLPYLTALCPGLLYALDSFYRQPLTHVLLSSNCLLFYINALKLPILPSLKAVKSFFSYHLEDYRNTISTTATAKKDQRAGAFPLFPVVKNPVSMSHVWLKSFLIWQAYCCSCVVILLLFLWRRHMC